MIEEAVKKATIEFPTDMSLRQTHRLIAYIAKILPANINYHFSQHINVGYLVGHEGFSKDLETAEITGRISRAEEPIVFDSFRFKHSEHDTSKFSLMQFLIVSNWEPEDYRPEVRKLWGDVRKLVNKYFRNGI